MRINNVLLECYVANTGPKWERACSRKRWISGYMCGLTHRIREQARSHSFDRVSTVGTVLRVRYPPTPTPGSP
ncbi:hypothetical protein C9382_03590 [Pseudomonas aylmerensis]|uniref:Uncharacterized protein n=1 Tax=Pseudomonas aylmerensis TaxID=1869229 RepID=A0A2T4GA02_9PSED|nr:hypothetical protein C9382_03590 [Pseudomonas aylmerensis]